ncbi:MAG: PAS domain S-box protein [bacterium]
MNDSEKTKDELVKDLEDLREQVADLERREDQHEQIEEKLWTALKEAQEREAEISGLFAGSHAVLVYRELEDSARSIFDLCKNLVGAAAGFVALSSDESEECGETDKEKELKVLFFDAGKRPHTADLSLPLPIRGLHAEAYRTGKPVYHNDFANSEWAKSVPEGYGDFDNVLFTPLVIRGQSLGLLALVGKPGGFVDNDARTAMAFGELSAVALDNNRTLISLENSEKRYRELVETMNDGLGMQDEKGIITFVNDRLTEMLGLKKEEVIGRPASDFLDEANESIRRDQIAKRKQGQSSSYELEWMAKDGRRILTLMSVRPLVGDDGRFKGSLAVITDITEYRKLEQQLRHVQKMEAIGQIAGGVAHNINNLLSGIAGNLSLVENAAPQEIRQYLTNANGAADQAAKLVQQLLAFGRKSHVDLKPVNLNQIVEHACNLARETIDRRVDLAIQSEEGLPDICADAAQMTSVLMNLCANARDAINEVLEGRTAPERTTEQFAIAIRTETTIIDQDYCDSHSYARRGRFVILSVCDNGAGIAPEIQGRVFEPFFTTKESERAIGMGLASAYGIIKQHEGWINLHSEPGKGTTIQIYLPVVE